ncbi:MAG: hypothetical protein RLY69_710, partial [Verrucomicrobiota bacterium]
MIQNPKSSARLVGAMFFFGPIVPIMAQNTPAPAQIAVTDVISPAQINRLFNEVDADFESKNFSAIPAKINLLIKALANTPDAPLETLYFNIGLAHLLDNKAAEAEAGFRECLKRFPNGEYASRCFLGAGRALTMQGSEEKKNQAIEPLKRAAADPKFRSEAGLILGQVYTDLGKHDDALQVFRSLMGSDVRTPTQTAAAVQSVSLLANSGSLKDLIAYLDRLSSQAGVRDAIAWYVNQNIVCADELVSNQLFEPALAIYRSIPPRSQIISTQAAALNEMRKELKILETRAEADKAKPANQRTKAAELVGALKPAIKVAEEAYKAIDEKADFDAAVLMRRGRCLFYLERHEEALVCFRKLRTKYGSSVDAKSAAFAEIVILNKRQDIASIKELCEAYMQKYPDAENIEQVATLAGEVLVQSGDWKEVASFYRGLETKFPQSENLDRFVFFQSLAVFQEGRFAEAAPMISKFLKDHPQSLLVENAMYYFAMSNFLSNKYKETLAACNDYLNKFPDGRYAGDMRYRLAFVDFNDKEEDQSEKVIRDLSKFLSEHPNDSS